MFKNDESDDDDYMSDKFLPASDDVRPGLVFQVTAKRRLEQEVRQRQLNEASRTKKLRVIEAERREEGLGTQLGAGNRGFELLQKMGYKPGTSLGKDGTDGRLEPVPIEVKSGRAGLGREQLLQQKRLEVNEMKHALQLRRQTRLVDQSRDFLRHQRAKALDRQTQSDLYSSQKACQQLDQQMDLVEPAELWFWPKIPVPQGGLLQKDDDDSNSSSSSSSSSSSEDEDDVDKLEPAEQLEILTSYLRNTHFFCVWCGTTYEGETDLQENCPGKTSECH